MCVMHESRVEAQMIGDDPVSFSAKFNLAIAIADMQPFDIIKVQQLCQSSFKAGSRAVSSLSYALQKQRRASP